MKNPKCLILALVLATPALGATAQSSAQHEQHHPPAAAAAAAAEPTPGAMSPAGPDMAARMEAMRAMHERMLAAKTPAERQALMGEHMKAMRGGMAAMSGASMRGANCEPGAHGAMEQRMQMMEMMMQMMMDRIDK